MGGDMLIQGKSIFDNKTIQIELEDGYIKEIEEIEGGESTSYLSPGFLDMQVNGFYGIDYSLENLEAEQVETLIRQLATSGTTKHVPTFVTMPKERLLKNLSIVKQAMADNMLVNASIVGFHIEGPFISSEDGPRGAHDRDFVRDPDFSEFLQWQEASGGLIKWVTLSPQRDGAIEFIEKATTAGVKIGIGHTGASVDQIQQAIKAGATISTHLGNGSNTHLPRLKNYLWEQLAADELYAGLICDSFHLPPSVVKVFTRVKTLDRIILVSDVAYLGGLEPGLYKWGNLDVEIFKDGHLGLPGTSILAGAAHLLDWDIPLFMKYTGSSLLETIRLCTLQPSQFLDLNPNKLKGLRLEIKQILRYLILLNHGLR